MQEGKGCREVPGHITLRRPGARTLAASAAALLAPLVFGCASTLPPRPVPLPEGQPNLPGWYPEKPWTDQSSQRVYLEGKVVFDTAHWTIRPESERVLKQLLEYLQANPDISRVRLEGHTDSRAGEEYNQKLSERRALAIADWLVDHGLDNMRLLAVAFGKSRPMRTNATADGRQENRRTEFRIAEVGGARFLGRDPTNGGLVLEVLSKEDRDRAKQVGKVPTYVEPPWQPQRDIIAPVNALPKAVGTEDTSSAPDQKTDAAAAKSGDGKAGTPPVAPKSDGKPPPEPAPPAEQVLPAGK